MQMVAQPEVIADRSVVRNEAVVLVHGLASAPLVMQLLKQRLARYGYATRPWGYASILRDIEHHGQRLARFLEQQDQTPGLRHLHLVTHSMGCIVARYALNLYRPKNLRRMVMLAPPNRGSHVASALAPLLGRLCKPLVQLKDEEDSFVNRLRSPERLEVGIIAAAWDSVVRLSSTQVDWQADHMVVPALHTGLLFRDDVARQVHNFLQRGQFLPRP